MRWERLFADLEAELDAAERAAEDAEISDRTRREAARLTLGHRARGALGRQVQLHVLGAGPVRGQLVGVGADWLLVVDEPVDVLVPFAAVLGVDGLGRWSASPDGAVPVTARLGLGVPLRAVARDRAPVRLTLVDGSTADGTLDRVGDGVLELALHPAGEPRRPAAVRGVRVVPFAALAAVRSR